MSRLITLILIRSLNGTRNEDYALTSSNLSQYRERLNKLKATILIWPPPPQVEQVAKKDILIGHMDRISQQMGTMRPETKKLARGDPIPTGTVLKRTHSDSGQHVILPASEYRQWSNMEQGPPEAQWLSQEFVPTLRSIGEWRVVIVNLTIQYVTHTLAAKDGSQALSSKPVEGYYSLDEWR